MCVSVSVDVVFHAVVFYRARADLAFFLPIIGGIHATWW